MGQPRQPIDNPNQGHIDQGRVNDRLPAELGLIERRVWDRRRQVDRRSVKPEVTDTIRTCPCGATFIGSTIEVFQAVRTHFQLVHGGDPVSLEVIPKYQQLPTGHDLQYPEGR
jgi:hypothetical protein